MLVRLSETLAQLTPTHVAESETEVDGFSE